MNTVISMLINPFTYLSFELRVLCSDVIRNFI